MSDDVFLSVVIPAFNEEKRIGRTLDAVIAFLKLQPYNSEIVLADDGSVDSTLRVARDKLGGFPHQIVSNPVNLGKGAAVKRGMLAASGSIRLFSDADLSTPIEEATRFVQHHSKGCDVVIGSSLDFHGLLSP